jgi:hypothetical protein
VVVLLSSMLLESLSHSTLLVLHQHGKSLVAKLYRNGSSPPTLGEVKEEEEFWRIPTSIAPLERGRGGRHRTIQVTEHGSSVCCGARLRDLEIDA